MAVVVAVAVAAVVAEVAGMAIRIMDMAAAIMATAAGAAAVTDGSNADDSLPTCRLGTQLHACSSFTFGQPYYRQLGIC